MLHNTTETNDTMNAEPSQTLSPDEMIKNYSQAIGKGLSGAGLHRTIMASRVEQICNAVYEGDAEAFSELIFDTLGESAGLVAGKSEMGKEALASLVLAQSDCFIALREANDSALAPSLVEDMEAIQKLLVAHQAQLYHWVKTGKTRIDNTDYESDLNAISEFLNTPEYRAGAMASVIAGIEVLHQGLALFTGKKEKAV